MLAKDIMMGIPTQPLINPKDASVTNEGTRFPPDCSSTAVLPTGRAAAAVGLPGTL